MKKWLYSIAFNFILREHTKFVYNKLKGTRLNLSRRYMPRVDMSESLFPDSNFTNSSLKYCKFNNARMEFSNFAGANLYDCDLSNVTFANSKFSKSNFDNAILFEADLSQAQMRQTQLNIHVKNRQKEDLLLIIKALEEMGYGVTKSSILRKFKMLGIQDPLGRNLW